LPVLQDRVDFHLVLGAVVEQLGALARPGELAGQFHQDEPLEQRGHRSRHFRGDLAARLMVKWSLVAW
jgi:hypothetical protein